MSETHSVEPQQFTVDELELRDIDFLLEIIGSWIPDENMDKLEELEEIRMRMEGSMHNNGYTYLVARNTNGIAIGVMGIRKPEDKMIEFATPDANSAELVNAFRSQHADSKGVGRALLDSIKKRAKDLGFTEIILNSGPRYEITGWGFYKKTIGEPITIAYGYYGVGHHAPVWKITL